MSAMFFFNYPINITTIKYINNIPSNLSNFTNKISKKSNKFKKRAVFSKKTNYNVVKQTSLSDRDSIESL